MSKKTRQQKIIADQRRSGFFISVHKESIVTEDYSYVKRDLLKIFIFTLFAIGAQLVLWYVGRK